MAEKKVRKVIEKKCGEDGCLACERAGYFRVPMKLITDEEYRHVKVGAKILYGMMLDRTALSARKKKWHDDKGRAFIHYTYDEIYSQTGWADSTISRYFKELADIGLVESVCKTANKPNVIYVKDFASGKKADRPDTAEAGERSKGKPEYDYFYGDEAAKYSFLRIPKALILFKEFNEISMKAKLLYSLMLDRRSLSGKNGLLVTDVDPGCASAVAEARLGRDAVYIYFSYGGAKKMLGWSKQTYSNCKKELLEARMINVINKKGKTADKIYVAEPDAAAHIWRRNAALKAEDFGENSVLAKVDNKDFRTSKTRQDVLAKVDNSVLAKLDTSQIDRNQTNKINHARARDLDVAEDTGRRMDDGLMREPMEEASFKTQNPGSSNPVCDDAGKRADMEERTGVECESYRKIAKDIKSGRYLAIVNEMPNADVVYRGLDLITSADLQEVANRVSASMAGGRVSNVVAYKVKAICNKAVACVEADETVSSRMGVAADNAATRTRPAVRPKANGFHNFEQRETDYDALMMQQVRGWLFADGVIGDGDGGGDGKKQDGAGVSDALRD